MVGLVVSMKAGDSGSGSDGETVNMLLDNWPTIELVIMFVMYD